LVAQRGTPGSTEAGPRRVGPRGPGRQSRGRPRRGLPMHRRAPARLRASPAFGDDRGWLL